MRCKDPEFKQMHRFAKQALLEKRFKCPNYGNGCQAHIHHPSEYCFKYEEALQHLKSCQVMKCPFECGQKMMRDTLDTHFQQCPNAYVECEKCEVEFKRIEENQHDCFTAMKQRIKELSEQNEKLAQDSETLNDLGFSGIVEPRPDCMKGHPMKLHRGNPYKRGHVRCDQCRQSQMEFHPFFYRCGICDCVFCRACTCIKGGVLQPIVYVKFHPHGLAFIPDKNDGWECDTRHHAGTCESGITGFKQSNNI